MTKIIDIKSFLIGFLLAISVILLMGLKKGDLLYENYHEEDSHLLEMLIKEAIMDQAVAQDLIETGRYQVSTCIAHNTSGHVIYETIIDTKTGSIVSRIKLFSSAFSKK